MTLSKLKSFSIPVITLFISILFSIIIVFGHNVTNLNSQACDNSLPKKPVLCPAPSNQDQPNEALPQTCSPTMCHFNLSSEGSTSFGIRVTCTQTYYGGVTVMVDYCDNRQSTEICAGVSPLSITQETSNGCNQSQTNPSLEAYCGDGFCTASENYSYCAADCNLNGGSTYTPSPTGAYNQDSLVFTINPFSRTVIKGNNTALYNVEVYGSGIYSGSVTGTLTVTNCPTGATCTFLGDNSVIFSSSNSDSYVTKVLQITTTSATPVSSYLFNVNLNFLAFSKQKQAYLVVQDYLYEPTLYIDSPANGANVSGTLNVLGWAIDNQYTREGPISSKKVYVDNVFVGNGTSYNRQDVCNVYPSRQGCPNVGFGYSLDTTTLSNGTHTLRFEATDSDNPPRTVTETRTINVNNASGSAIIQGYKVKSTNFSTTDNPPAGQTVTLNGGSSTTANPYSFAGLTLGTNYTVSVSVPSGWTSGYTLCYGNTSCHSNTPTSGSSATVNVPSTLPVGQRYADLWWHLTPPVNTPPSITLNGSNPVSVTVGTSWTDPGATATDAEDGNLTSAIVTTGTVNTSVVGTYTKTYSVTDSGGLSDSKTRTINVVSANNPNTPPSITLNGSTPVSVTVGTSWTDPGATATDAEDGNLTSAIVTTGTVNTSVVGPYTKTYSVTDRGNPPLSASITRTINVVSATPPNTAPSIALIGSTPVSVTVGTSWTDPGATATDAEDGNLTSAIVTTGTVNTSVVGPYTKTYSVTDRGNPPLSASITRTINVVSGSGSNFTLTVNRSTGGTVTSNVGGINCGNTCSAVFSSNTSVILTATPLNAQWIFVGWGGACSGTSSTCTVVMSSSKTVTAEFRPRPFDYREF